MSEPKPYIELSDFPALTPYSSAAIRGYMQRGELVEGVHYFRGPATGKRAGKPVFKWDAIVKWIEERARRESSTPVDVGPVLARRHA